MQIWTGEDLKAWRVRMGLTQAQAAEQLDIGLRTYSDRENGGKVTMECMLACKMIEHQQHEFSAGLDKIIQGDSDLAREIRRQAREQRVTRLAIESIIETFARRDGTDIMARFFEVFSKRANIDMSNDSPETRGYLYEAVQGTMNRIRTNVMRL